MLYSVIKFAKLLIFQPSDVESFEESDDDGSEYSEASEDSDSDGIIFLILFSLIINIWWNIVLHLRRRIRFF